MKKTWKKLSNFLIARFLWCFFLSGLTIGVVGQNTDTTQTIVRGKVSGVSAIPPVDSSQSKAADSIKVKNKRGFKNNPNHSPVKATLLSVGLPGAGQIYNGKWWKAPIVWGGLGTCFYFVATNQINFIKFRDAYRNRLDGLSEPEFIGYTAEGLREERNYYQRNRDLFIIISAGVYALQIIDATVDGHLYHFNVNDDLSLKVSPSGGFTPWGDGYVGLGVKMNFTSKK